MIITNYLKSINYDYLPCVVGDGKHDDAPIMQMRIDAGLNPLECSYGKTIYLGSPVKLRENTVIDGRNLTNKVM